jgi:predicted GNAT family acetyltransferase
MYEKLQENTQLHRFELTISQVLIATAYYRDEGSRIVLFRTEIPSGCVGRSIGWRLAQGIFDLLRTSGRKAVLRCPLMSRFLATRLDYLDVIAG